MPKIYNTYEELKLTASRIISVPVILIYNTYEELKLNYDVMLGTDRGWFIIPMRNWN